MQRDSKGKFTKQNATPTEITERVALPGTNINMEAVVKVRRVGQQSPGKGDQVVAEATLFLPATDKNIAREIRFMERCYVMGQSLTHLWGVPTGATWCWRHSSQTRTADTWHEALNGARIEVEEELDGLIKKLKARKQKLKDAE